MRELCRRVLWFGQRGCRGYSDEDTWNFDKYLARVIAGGVRAIRARDISYSGESEEAWNTILDEMADGFEAWADAQTWDDRHGEVKLKLQKSLALLQTHFGALWD